MPDDTEPPPPHTPLTVAWIVWLLAGLFAWIYTWPQGPDVPGPERATSLLLLFVALLGASVCWVGSLAVRRRR